MDNLYKQSYLKEYNNFVDQLKIIFPSEETVNILNTLNEINDDTKIDNGKLFSSK